MDVQHTNLKLLGGLALNSWYCGAFRIAEVVIYVFDIESR